MAALNYVGLHANLSTAELWLSCLQTGVWADGERTGLCDMLRNTEWGCGAIKLTNNLALGVVINASQGNSVKYKLAYSEYRGFFFKKMSACIRQVWILIHSHFHLYNPTFQKSIKQNNPYFKIYICKTINQTYCHLKPSEEKRNVMWNLDLWCWDIKINEAK